MVHRSDQVAAWLAEQGVRRGDRVMVMLGNQVELWETMLAVMKLGAVILPATTALGPADLADRIERGGAKHVVTSAANTAKFAEVPGDYGRIVVDGDVRLGRLPRCATMLNRRSHTRNRPGRPAAAVLHFGTAVPQTRQQPRIPRPLDDHVLIGCAPATPQHQLIGLGETRVGYNFPRIAETVFVYNCPVLDAAALLAPSPRRGHRSAHRRPCGGCSSTRTSAAPGALRDRRRR